MKYSTAIIIGAGIPDTQVASIPLDTTGCLNVDILGC